MNIIERYERKFSTAAKNKTTNSLRTGREEILKNARREMKEWASLSSLFNFLPVALRFLFRYYYRMPAGFRLIYSSLLFFFLLFSLPLSLSFSLPFLCMYFSLNKAINKQSTQRANKRRRNNKSETRKICCNGHDLINVRCIAWSNGPRTMLKRVISQST